jgi:hypothetical protein
MLVDNSELDDMHKQVRRNTATARKIRRQLVRGELVRQRTQLNSDPDFSIGETQREKGEE